MSFDPLARGGPSPAGIEANRGRQFGEKNERGAFGAPFLLRDCEIFDSRDYEEAEKSEN
jgi:hypothetical protein